MAKQKMTLILNKYIYNSIKKKIIKNKEKTREKEVKLNTKSKIKKVGIITNGGDAPGLNTVIWSIVKSAEENNIEVYGFIDGYEGLLHNNYIKLESKLNVEELLTSGGTFIGTSNSTNLFHYKTKMPDGTVKYIDYSKEVAQRIKKEEFDCIFVLRRRWFFKIRKRFFNFRSKLYRNTKNN